MDKIEHNFRLCKIYFVFLTDFSLKADVFNSVVLFSMFVSSELRHLETNPTKKPIRKNLFILERECFLGVPISFY